MKNDDGFIKENMNNEVSFNAITSMFINVFTNIFINFYENLKHIMQQIISSTKQTPEQIQSNIIQILQEQERKMGAGSFMQLNYMQLQYVMCALADEIMLGAQWSGRVWWMDNLLEYRFFKTRCAGEKIFQQIDHLLVKPQAYEKALLPVYLYLLSLGFRGKLNFQDNKNADEYKEKLFFAMYGVMPTQVKNNNIELNVMRGKIDIVDQRMNKWIKILLAGTVIYCIASHCIWMYHTFWLTKLDYAISKQLDNIKTENVKNKDLS